jgi:hypothetical protein
MVVPMPRSQAPSHRHAAPCGPWPWMDLRDDIEPASVGYSSEPHQCPHPTGQCEGCWAGYPQSLFPNWTSDQVGRSKMKQITMQSDKCVIRRVEVKDGGDFYDPGSQRAPDSEEFWRILQESVSNVYLKPDINRSRCSYASSETCGQCSCSCLVCREHFGTSAADARNKVCYLTDIFSKMTWQIDIKSNLFSGHPLLTGSHPGTKRTPVRTKEIVIRMLYSSHRASAELSARYHYHFIVSSCNKTRRCASSIP